MLLLLGCKRHALHHPWSLHAPATCHLPPVPVSFQMRGLYHTLTLAMMPSDAAVVGMVEAELTASRAGLRAAAQRAAIAASHRC